MVVIMSCQFLGGHLSMVISHCRPVGACWFGLLGRRGSYGLGICLGSVGRCGGMSGGAGWYLNLQAVSRGALG